MGDTAEDLTRDLAVTCTLPSPDDHDELPDWGEAWRTSEFCEHPECIEADWMARLYARTPKQASREERAMDFHALHGRDPGWGEETL